ncbi:MAG TPA: type Z 30S ribosomal protein S14 [Candidatus Omnitrophota bacterium]|nr:type Z 30S ribosomal protein S14 [Candidatus Omnitrophota bacterium]
MAKTCLVVKQREGRFKFKVRQYNRCKRCGRSRGVLKRFSLCRICMRELAHRGMIPGMKKSSW